MSKHPGKKKNKWGVTHFVQGILRTGGKKSKSVYGIVDALQLEAVCGPCGCDPCLGYWTQIDVDTGEVNAVFIEGGALTVMPLDQAKPYLKDKKANR